MTLAIERRAAKATDETVQLIQDRRRSNAAGLHYTKPRGGRRDVNRQAIRESYASFDDDGD